MVSLRCKVSRTAILTMMFFRGQTRTQKSPTNMFQTPLPTTRLWLHAHKLIQKGGQHLESDFNYKVSSSVASFEISWAKHLRAKFDPILILMLTVKLTARDNTPVRWWPNDCQVWFDVSETYKLYPVDRQTTTLFFSNSSGSQWLVFPTNLNFAPEASISLVATLTKFIIPPF